MTFTKLNSIKYYPLHIDFIINFFYIYCYNITHFQFILNMKILSTLIFSLLTTILLAQTVNYQVEIVEFRISGCDDGFGFDEEPTWKAWGRDDINTAFVGGSCFQQDANVPFTHSAGNTLLIAQSATNATTIDIKLEAWEDDNISSADRCSYDSGDDCHVDNIFPSINYQNDPHCAWNEYVLTSGDFTVVVRINWEFTTFDGGTNIIDCSTTVPLSSQGSGSWSVYSGMSGSFGDVNNPSTNFSGSLGSYVLLWSSLPNCLNVYNPDTVTVDFISTPEPNMTLSSNTICEGTDVTFNAQNGTIYDWSLNTHGNVVLSDGSGQFVLTPSIADNIVYVTSNNGTCSGTDSISFTVNPSPIPTISENGGVLSTQTYPVYLWYLNGSPIPGATNIDYTPTQGGSYYVEVVNASGCAGQSDPVTFSGVGIDELITNVSIYPNPTSGVLHIQSELPIAFATVYNSIGKKIQVRLIDNELDLSQLSNGVYIVQLSINSHIITKRIILSK